MRTLLITTSLFVFLIGSALVQANWPHWRGPSHNGVSTETGLPVSWGATCQSDGAAAGPEASAPAAPGRGGFGGGGRGRGGFGGFGEGRPIVPLACKAFDTTNVSWRLPLPAYSGSTPIIWGDMIFLNVATAPNTGVLELWAVDRRTKAVAWKRPRHARSAS